VPFWDVHTGCAILTAMSHVMCHSGVSNMLLSALSSPTRVCSQVVGCLPPLCHPTLLPAFLLLPPCLTPACCLPSPSPLLVWSQHFLFFPFFCQLSFGPTGQGVDFLNFDNCLPSFPSLPLVWSRLVVSLPALSGPSLLFHCLLPLSVWSQLARAWISSSSTTASTTCPRHTRGAQEAHRRGQKHQGHTIEARGTRGTLQGPEAPGTHGTSREKSQHLHVHFGLFSPALPS